MVVTDISDQEGKNKYNGPCQHSHPDNSIQSFNTLLATMWSQCLVNVHITFWLLSVTDCGVGRADALGKLGVSYAIGMVIGPFIGGLITKNYGEQSAAFFAAAFSFISIFIALLFIPHNTKSLSKGDKSAEKLPTGEEWC